MFKTRKIGSVIVVEAQGELDARNSDAAKEALKALIAGGENQMVIDLHELSFIDSSGLGALITALKAARTAGGDVRLCAITPSARTLFELTRLIRVFSIFGSTSEAVASFA